MMTVSELDAKEPGLLLSGLIRSLIIFFEVFIVGGNAGHGSLSINDFHEVLNSDLRGA